MHTVTLVVMYLCQRGVYWELMEIWAPKPRDLGVHIGVDAAGKQGIVGKVDAWNHMRSTERHLLRLGEEVIGVTVQDHAAYRAHGNQFLGDELGGVEDVKTERIGLLLGEDLHAKFVFRIGAGLDAFPQVAPVVVRVRARDLDRLVPDQRMRARLGVPVELDEDRLSLCIDEAEGVHAKTLHRGEAAGMARSDISHISMWVDSGMSETKSQNVSWALAACGIW